MESLISAALKTNPRIEAAERHVAEIAAAHRRVFGFFDGQLVSAVGAAEEARGIAGTEGFPGIGSDLVAARVTVEKPFKPGFYLAAGAAERLITDSVEGRDRWYETRLGVQVRLPLARDRGFRQWNLREQAAAAELRAAVSRLEDVRQQIRHEVERAYIDAQQSLSTHRIAQKATERFETVRTEAQKLAEMEAIPQYQVYPARMESHLRKEEELDSERNHRTRLIRLRELIGDGRTITVRDATELLIRTAESARLPGDHALAAALRRRARYQALQHDLAAAEARISRARDDLKPNLSLNVRTTWDGEHDDAPFGGLDGVDAQHAGAEAVIEWSRPLGYTAERHELDRLESRAAILRHRLREIRLNIRADLETSVLAFTTARRRFELVSKAVDAARRNLTAEQERFRLGEARSRDVLDAQKDVTDTVQRQSRVAAALLRAKADFHFASGYAYAARKE